MKNNYLLTYFKTGLMLFFLCFTAVSAVAQVVGTQPMSHTVIAGKPTSFSITTIGNGSFSYLWLVSTNGGNSFLRLTNGGIYSGANTATLNISKTTVSMSGYLYKVVLTGASIGVAESNTATLTVTVPSLVGNRDWKFVGAANITELGVQSTSIAIDPTGTPYIAYRRNEDKQYFAVVKKFNGTSWETLPTDGLTTDWVNQPVLTTNSLGVPYLSYSNLIGYKGVVKKFNGVNWETLGNSSFSEGQVAHLSFSFDNLDTPHAVYYDTQLGNKGTVKKFNGTSWVQVGSPTFSNGIAYYFSTAFNSSNTEYVAYRDESNGSKARVIKFNGTNWENVGTPDISVGRSHYTTVAIDAANTVYLSYRDEVNGDKIRVLKFNGTDWVPVGAAFVSDIATQYSRLVLDPAGTPYIHAHTSDFKNLLFKFDGTNWQKINTDTILSVLDGSLAFNSEGTPYIAYEDRITGKANVVKYDIAIPVITSQPLNSMVTGGRGVNFGATVTGGSLTYQWQVSTDGGTTFTSIVNGATYGDVTKARMYINNAPISMNNYQYRLVVNNGVEVISRAAVLNVESPEYNTTREWHLVGTQGFSNASLNDAPSMSIDQMGRPNVGYVDLSTGGKISVQRFENTTWETLGETTATTHSANFPSMKCDIFGKPYIAYQDIALGGKASVVRHDGRNWITIGDAGFSNGRISSITSAAASNGVPFVAYADSSNGNKVTIKKFNGSSWENIGNPNFTNNEVKNISLAIDFWGIPSIAYQDADNDEKITVKKFDGTNWTDVGNPGFSDAKADNITLAIDAASLPYVVYQDSDSNNNPKINVKRLNGTTWENVGNTLPAVKIQHLSFVLDKSGTPFIGYNDYNDNLKTTVKRLINGNWENVGSSSFSEGATSFPTLVISQVGVPYMAYADATKENKLTVMQYNMALTISQKNVTCAGDNNGSATVTVTGGQEPFYYEWSSNDSESDEDQPDEVSGLTKGTYSVTVTDYDGNQIKKSFVITEPDALKATKTQTEVLCYGDSSGTATVSVTGGTADYTYSWLPSGGTEATATGLKAGTYEVTIKDAKDCTITENFTITQPTSALVATAGPKTNVSCNGGNNGSATVSATGGTGDYTYSWLPSGGTNATATGLTAGTYVVTVTDSNGCTNSVSDIHIGEPEALIATVASQENISCAGAANGSLAVSAAGGSFPYTYKWSENAGGATTPKISGLAGGTYSVKVTDSNNCSFTLADILINEPAVLAATTGSQKDVSCNGGANGSATVNVAGGVFPYTYNWEPSGGNEATATGLSAGHYVVTVQDANLCTTSHAFIISQPLFALSATTTQNNISCNEGNNGSATVSVTGGTGNYTYSWLPSGATGATATGLTAGLHTVTITDANLCTIKQSVTITTIPDEIVPVPDVTNLPGITNYCAVLATDIAIPTATDNCSGVIKATTNDPLNYTTEGSYTINWKYTDSSNNSTTQTQTINVIASSLKQASFSNKEFSYDGTQHAIQIENLPAGATVTYTTTPATGSANSAKNVGIYTVTATITPASQMSNCTVLVLTAEIKINKAAQQITFDALPTKSIGKDNSFQLEAKSNSGLPVSYTFSYASALAPATISSSGLVSLLQSGEVTIVAHQDGNDNYLSANTVSQVLEIKSGSASIAQITIDNQKFENPQQQINYLLDCGQSNPTIAIQTENNSLVFPANTFTIPTPKVGVYKQDITVTSQDGTISKNYVINVERRFNFFDIVQQKFNNVLLVNNNPQTNGGYEFVSYQWFKNGQLISTGQSYSAGDNSTDTLDTTADYSVKMTTKDGLVLQTCSAVIQKLNSFQAKLYPNPIQAGQTITIDADYPIQELEKMRISIYTISGSLIQTIQSSTAKTQMQLPPALQNGTYIVVLETSNTKKSFKVIVNK